MTILEMMQHYTCSMGFNKLKKVLLRWEKFVKVTEWGWSWEGGYLIEEIDGRRVHVHGWKIADAPWMNQAWVYMDYYDDLDSEDYARLLVQQDWQYYPIEVSR